MAKRVRPLNHKERLALIHLRMPPVQYCFSQKRWAGVIVNDNFGEGMAKRAIQRRKNWVADSDDSVVTQFDTSFFLADYEEWERIADNDQII